MTKLRIFLADDHAIVREGITVLINAQRDMEVVGETGDGASVVAEVRACLPHVVIMDISMPLLNGVRATRQLKNAMPNVKTIALSAHEDKSYLREMLQAGATGYVLKRAVTSDLIQAIRVVAAGGLYFDASLAGAVVGSLVGGSSDTAQIQQVTLSDREEEVLRLIAQGFTNKEIALQIGISIKTVDTYKARAMEKLHLDSRVALVRYAVLQGWLEAD